MKNKSKFRIKSNKTTRYKIKKSIKSYKEKIKIKIKRNNKNQIEYTNKIK